MIWNLNKQKNMIRKFLEKNISEKKNKRKIIKKQKNKKTIINNQ